VPTLAAAHIECAIVGGDGGTFCKAQGADERGGLEHRDEAWKVAGVHGAPSGSEAKVIRLRSRRIAQVDS
jgi:hypothetical protein